VAAPARTSDDLRALVAEHEWYHTLELAPGIVTPGWFDTRAVIEEIPFPTDLSGMRCLDVGTFDGFWAFEMERRGADEVVAIDVLDPRQWDWPVDHDPETVEAIGRRKAGGDGFLLVHEALGSSVSREELSVYDASPELLGTFDFVFVGSLLIHLRDPVRAVERVRDVCRGSALFLDNIDLALTLAHPRRPVAALDGRGRPWWWRLNLRGLVRVIEAGGFAVEGAPHRVYIPPGPGQKRAPLRPRALLSASAREAALISRVGDPHAAVSAQPIP
jgi:tRNA (mo5U34)-methyltransferase